MLKGGEDDEKFEHDKLWESFLAEHVVTEMALEFDDYEDGPDCCDEFEGLELCRLG